ncbi:MAG: hypothetical protein A2498_14175 [Lentisphaerae bacterium RIFOXYC12_FULL_60_16]|nr:MAG: hypothetical protein A2498_14175 [Lentisphaerae bacterium RIFOXYC12_FULL_60_16]OGV72970.1 MAG: hypothetical protein A2269_03365 [Lentisphaerae bacterium RIFOXYA12_FULL_60_10]OGV85162.1 MAG: hypothetical protein A2340_01180 [Lentisphaerae bacterium RIFOXYB12_FULL_60_10]
MEWVNLTSTALRDAARAGLPAVLPLGSIEAHSDHLPLGNDTFKVYRTCQKASELEPAVVLPPLFYTYVKSMETKCGAITLDGRLLVDLVEKIADEAGRNGFGKVLLASGHGGNNAWLNFLRNDVMDRGKSYLLYTYYVPLIANPDDKRLMKTAFDGHGGEVETSLALHLFPELCHMERHEVAAQPAIPDDYAGGAAGPYDWISAWPKALSGDPTPATAEKGKVFFESCVKALTHVIKAVKEDKTQAAFKLQYDTERLHD